AIGIDPGTYRRHYVGGIGQSALCEGESAFDVIKNQSVWCIGCLDLLDQQLLELIPRDRFFTFYNQVGLPRHNCVSLLTPSMSVRLGKAIDRCARHQEIFEYSVFDYCHPSAFHALIIKSVIAEKF